MRKSEAVVQHEPGLIHPHALNIKMSILMETIDRLYQEKAVSKAQFDAVSAQRKPRVQPSSNMEAALRLPRIRWPTVILPHRLTASFLRDARRRRSGRTFDSDFSIVKMDQVKIQIEVVENQSV
jgi:hypothetical protein